MPPCEMRLCVDQVAGRPSNSSRPSDVGRGTAAEKVSAAGAKPEWSMNKAFCAGCPEAIVMTSLDGAECQCRVLRLAHTSLSEGTEVEVFYNLNLRNWREIPARPRAGEEDHASTVRSSPSRATWAGLKGIHSWNLASHGLSRQ